MNTLILVLSLVAGVAGTGLGGALGALFKSRGSGVMGRVLSFAGGVMAGVVAFEMLPESIEKTEALGRIGAVAVSVSSLVLGMAMIFAIGKLLDILEHKKRTGQGDMYRASAMVQAAHMGRVRAVGAVAADRAGVRITSTDGRQTKRYIAGAADVSERERRRELVKAGTVMLIAIALHNFPEGMAIGAAGAVQTKMGVLVALIIAVHNIPEGMAIAAPLVSGGVRSGKAILLTALAGGATVLGALIGLAVGGLGDIATGVCMSLAGGAMLYVTFCDILPETIHLTDGAVPSASMLTGIICAAVFVYSF